MATKEKEEPKEDLNLLTEKEIQIRMLEQQTILLNNTRITRSKITAIHDVIMVLLILSIISGIAIAMSIS
tara:strand:+ start:2794 stop:3003 length:210 start_codon:yes stop_codon:yes gene_type:complete